MKKSGVIPSKQPTEMPNAPADSLTIRVVRIAACAADSAGASSPARTHHPSMASPNEMPATSLIRLPSPAAASVEKPRRTPSVASMRSPATIMMALSAKPKPTMGTPTPTASLISWCLLGGSAAAASSAASAASVDLGRANAGRRVLRRPGAHADHARRCAASRLRAEPNMDICTPRGQVAFRQWVIGYLDWFFLGAWSAPLASALASRLRYHNPGLSLWGEQGSPTTREYSTDLAIYRWVCGMGLA